MKPYNKNTATKSLSDTSGKNILSPGCALDAFYIRWCSASIAVVGLVTNNRSQATYKAHIFKFSLT